MSSSTLSAPTTLGVPRLDSTLVVSFFLLIGFGLVMVASSSMDFAASGYGDPWYFAKRQLVFLGLGFGLGLLVYNCPLNWWQHYSAYLLVLSIALLILVLIPGVGRVVNGSRRWLSFGAFGVQASEVVKLCLILFYASYLARRAEHVTHRWVSFAILVGIIAVVAALLLLEPDFGSCVILCFTLGIMMFVAGVPIIRFLLLSSFGVFSASLLVMTSEYRQERMLSFLNPFADPYDGGYQLVQSLIAFGRGDWFGLGLGNSIQKLFFLPDAHTDFIFAIIAEEFGLLGVVLFLALFSLFVAAILRTAITSLREGRLFGGYVALGVAALFAVQAFVNMGVASGLLPTKGLTLPFVSYGGSSLTIGCVLMALVLRVHAEVSDAR